MSDEKDDGDEAPPGTAGTGRPYVGMHFKCCNVYNRIYINRELTAYAGLCPRCGAPVEVRIGPGGTDDRFFTAV